jgi:IS1 family transposase
MGRAGLSFIGKLILVLASRRPDMFGLLSPWRSYRKPSKKRHKLHKEIVDPKVGDAYTFVGIERNTKLILAWHLGERGIVDTEACTEKLDRATSGHFQLTTDGWQPYENAVSYSLGVRVDYAMLIKIYANDREGEQKYSPPEVVRHNDKTLDWKS